MNVTKFLILLFVLPSILLASEKEDKIVSRVNSHIIIEDYRSAISEAEGGLRRYPNSKPLIESYIKALVANNEESKAIDTLKRLIKKYGEDRDIIEDLSWGVINKGCISTQYAVRLTSMIGAYLTHDVKAVNIIVDMMKDSNAVLRSVAVQLACSYLDAPLIKEVSRLLDEEKIWLVKLEVIKAVGIMRIKDSSPKLKKIITSEKSTYEEKTLAIESLISIHENIDPKKLKPMIVHPRAGLRQLACQMATHLRLKELKSEIYSLVNDPISDVRISALNAIALFYLDFADIDEIKEKVLTAIKDTDPAVSITASWVAMLIDPSFGSKYLEKWVYDDHVENRRLAAAAVASLGEKGVFIAKKAIKRSKDPYVKANIALGLIGQRVNVKECCDILYDILTKEKEMWMWDSSKNHLFQVLSPSHIRHLDQIPHYPEAIDQMTRLNLLSVLAVMEDSRAQDAIKTFLKEKIGVLQDLLQQHFCKKVMKKL